MRKSIKYTVLGMSLLFAGSGAATTLANSARRGFTPWAVYGEDNRQEPYEAGALESETAKSVAGRISIAHLKKEGNDYVVKRKTLGKEKCEKNRFAEQVIGPTCSGFLIKPDVLVTAGHCMTKESICTDNVWAFDYALKAPGDQTYTKIPSAKLYHCKKIIAQKFAEFGDIDYAIIQLDRPVLDRNPLVLDLEAKPELFVPLYAAGYPSGLPLKIVNGGKVLRNENSHSFDSDLDIFQGNSGSPVFDGITGKVIGITSHGHEDYARDPDDVNCKIPRVCNPGDNCHLSTASRVSNLMEVLKKANVE